MSSNSWKRVALAAEVRGAGPYAVAADGLDVVLVRTPAGLRAFEGRCPHRGALLGEGELHDGVLVCRNHRWRFDAETGRRDGGPECLASCPVRETEEEILVDVSALTRPSRAPLRARRRFQDLPGPPKLPLLGNSHLLKLDMMHLQFEAWGREYGTPYAFAIGPRKIVVFADKLDMMPVLRDRPEAFTRGSNLPPVFKELGVSGVFSAEGAAWRPQRRLSMEALSHRHLRAFYPTLASVAERLRQRWLRAAERSEVLDVAEELKRFTVDVTTQLAFGYDLDTLGKDDDVIQKKLGLIFPAFSRRLFTIIPWWRIFRMPADRAVDRAVAELRVWLSGLVTEARTRLTADPTLGERPRNFLEAMLTAHDENGKPFDDETIFGNAMTMLLAGEDTTAYTLAWCIHQLLEAPSDVTALHEELRSVMSDATVPPNIETANRLVYADGIANETMRLRPVAPLFFLEATADTVVGDVEIPAGMVVLLMVRPPAVNIANFDSPDEFRPARWLEDRPSRGPHDPSAHQPFGSGPRICPGRTLALLEMKMVLATLYQNFEIERVGSPTDVREQLSFTMMPVGLRVKLRPRKRAVAESSAAGELFAHG
jgi:cytochrome P450/nitrite reductase/ring-hydroxylating ferredoxin subunit